MPNNAHWLEQWPEKHRDHIEKVCREFHYTAIKLVENVSGGGGDTYLAAPQAPAGVPCSIVLKFVGRENARAEDEKTLEAGNFFPECNHVRKAIDLGEGPVCFVMQLAGGSEGQTFANFFASCSDTDVINGLLRRMFTQTLAGDRLTPEAAPENAFRCHRLDDPDKFREQLLALRPRAAVLLDWWNEAAAKDRSSSYKKLCHGDLHGKNIIVSQDAGSFKPWIIDFGRTDKHHVFFDFAKLERDIVLRMFASRSRNPVDEIPHLYPDISESIAPADTDLQKAAAAIRTIRQLARDVLPRSADWTKEYFTAVFAQYLFAAGNPRADFGQGESQQPGLRRAAVKVCELLRPVIEVALKCEPPINDHSSALVRHQALWRLAYAFLRLDQLPWGGWSRTLPTWMEAIWKGDGGATHRNPSMRTLGGADQTSVALYEFADYVESFLPVEKRDNFIQHNRVAERAIGVMRQTMTERGIFAGIAHPGGPPQVRHTSVAAAALLKLRKAVPDFEDADDLIRDCLQFLSDNVHRWAEDRTNVFAMWAALVKVRELLGEPSHETLERSVVDAISSVLKPIGKRLADEQFADPMPANTLHAPSEASLPTPYCQFWRMQRACFLMYLPFLATEQGRLNPTIPNQLKRRYARALHDLLETIDVHEGPRGRLVNYHQDSGRDGDSPPGRHADWGLSSSLAALQPQFVQNWLAEAGFEANNLDLKRNALTSALLATFDQYAKAPSIFHFTTGPSFARWLYLTPAKDISKDALLTLDDQLTQMLSNGVTERDLNELVGWICREADVENEVDRNSVREMLLDKLESGEYTPDRLPQPLNNWTGEYVPLCAKDTWSWRVKHAIQSTTISAYDGDAGLAYNKAYGDSPILMLIENLKPLLGSRQIQGMRALDVGCGPGQYALCLRKMGFEVDLIDASVTMLKTAAARLDLSSAPPPTNIYNLLNPPHQSEAYDLVFACAMMVHVSRQDAPRLYRRFFEMLKPEGVLFVNYKIQDHTLISLDGRYYEFYASSETPMAELEAAGFRIDHQYHAINRTNLFGRPRVIRWVNFYCKKPDASANRSVG